MSAYTIAIALWQKALHLLDTGGKWMDGWYEALRWRMGGLSDLSYNPAD